MKALFNRETIDNLLQFLKNLYQEYNRDKCVIRASSLAYSTLLALIPLTALIFSLFTAFGAFEGIRDTFQKFLLTLLVPTRQNEILEYFNQFLNQSKALGIVGLLLFAVTSIMLLNTISVNFNALWGSRYKKSFLGRFSTYTSVIIFGSLFIGASFTLTGPLTPFIEGLPHLSLLFKWILGLLPSLFFLFALWLMIAIIPSGRVHLRSAFFGALIGTILWEIIRRWFVYGTNYFIRMSVVYGSLAAIPIFLFWLYLIWLVILISLEVTFVHQHRHRWSGFRDLTDMEPAERVELGLEVFFLITQSFYRGEKPPTRSFLARQFTIPLNLVDRYLDQLSDAGFIISTDHPDPRLVPARDLGKIPFHQVLTILFGKAQPNGHIPDLSEEMTRRFQTYGSSSFNNLSVADIMEQETQQKKGE